MKQHSDIYYYDGSFNGYLTLLFEVQYNNLQVSGVKKMDKQQAALFPEPDFISTRPDSAQFLWNKLRTQKYSALKTLYFAFLSEDYQIETKLLAFYKRWQKLDGDTSEEDLSSTFHHIYNLANAVDREKIKVEQSLMIYPSPDNPCIKMIKPKYNVLPLISRYFRTRYRESEWLICDIRRKYGLHHQQGSLAFITIKPDQMRACDTPMKHPVNALKKSSSKGKRKSRPYEVMA